MFNYTVFVSFWVYLLQKNKEKHFENDLLKEVSCSVLR